MSRQAHTPSPSTRSERAGHDARPGGPVSLWLDHAAVITSDLERSVEFYTIVVGLRVHVEEEDPLRSGRRRAMLFDSNGRDVIEIIELPDFQHRAVAGRGYVHHLGFRFPPADWSALLQRLDDRGHPYRIEDGILFVRDADGLLLEITRF